MRECLLALDTSSVRGSVALLDGATLLRQIDLEEGLRHGAALLPAARDLLRDAGLAPHTLAAVTVGVGPGSYTGTRIGVMAAKALAWGAGVPLVGVSSLAALALDARRLAARIVPVMDARRDEVYCAVYESADEPRALRADTALTPEEAAALAEGAGFALVGTALAKYPDLFAARAAAGIVVSQEFVAPSAQAIGQLAYAKLRRGETDDALALQPAYRRRDDAPPVFERE